MRVASAVVAWVSLLASSARGLSTMPSTRTCAVFWDIDGTMCDSFNLAFDATNRALTTAGHAAVSMDEYKAYTIYTTPERLARHARLVPGSAEFAAQGAELGATFDSDYIALVSPQTAPLFDGLPALFAKIAEIDAVGMGCLTNAARGYADAVVATHDLAGIFEVIHGADDVPRAKPHPEGLALCAAEMGVSVEHCVYIGDSPTDGQAAKAAKFGLALGLALENGSAHTVESLGPHFDLVVESVADLEEALWKFGPLLEAK